MVARVGEREREGREGGGANGVVFPRDDVESAAWRFFLTADDAARRTLAE